MFIPSVTGFHALREPGPRFVLLIMAVAGQDQQATKRPDQWWFAEREYPVKERYRRSAM